MKEQRTVSIKIGILQADDVLPNLAVQYGEYPSHVSAATARG